MLGRFLIPLERVIFALSEALDCVNSQVVRHQLRVSYIARLVGRELGFKGPKLEALVMAGALHDIGLFTVRDKLLALEEEPSVVEEHALVGYHILRAFPPLRLAAEFVLHHHAPWKEISEELDPLVALGNNIIYLADRVEVKARKLKPLLLYKDEVLEELKAQRGKYAPEVLEAFFKVASKDLFWLRLEFFKEEKEVVFQLDTHTHISCEELDSLASLFAIVIDMRSPFTRIHSYGVAQVANWLGKEAGFTSNQLEYLRTAAYLHDLGKLAVPEHILNKPGPLDPAEWSVLKAHPFVTYRILENIPYFETITEWASFHHERLDGRGYPSGRRSLSQGSRIIAVADVTTALLEDRPYRKRLELSRVRDILSDLSGTALDAELVGIVVKNLDFVRELLERARRDRDRHIESWVRLTTGL